MTQKFKYIIGIDEAGEKCWEYFARGCLVFSEGLIENTDNLNSSCKEGVHFLYDYEV